MAISSDQNRVAYSGDGSSAVFNFQYEFHAESDLGVFIYNSSRPTFIVEQVLNTDYTVSGDQDSQDRFLNGANVVMNSSPATGDEIVIFRSSAVNSVFSLPFTGVIPSAELVKALDRLTLLAQRLNDQVTRSVRLDDAYPFAFDTKLPENLTPGAPLIVNSGATGVTLGVVAAGSSFIGILPMVNGGTGANLAPGVGDILYAASATAMSALSAGSAGEVLMAKGAAAPQYEKINVGSSEQITGILPVGNGGIGTSSFPVAQILYGTSATSLLGISLGTDQPLVGNTGGVPSGQPLNMASGSSVTGALGVANGGTGQTTAIAAFDTLSPTTTKGDLVVFGTSDISARFPVGADGNFLKADSSTDSGFVYDTPALGNLTVASKTHQDSPYLVDTADKVLLFNADSSAITVNLFDAVGNSGKTVYMKKTDSSNNLVTVNGSSTQSIDGTSAITINIQNESLRLISDGTNWNILSNTYDACHVFVNNSSAQTIIHNSATVIINWSPIDDNYSAFNTLTGVFTAPFDGSFTFEHSWLYQPTIGARTLAFLKHYESDGQTVINEANGFGFVIGGESAGTMVTNFNMNKGEIVKPFAYQSEGTNENLATAPNKNFITFSVVGVK